MKWAWLWQCLQGALTYMKVLWLNAITEQQLHIHIIFHVKKSSHIPFYIGKSLGNINI